MSGELLSLLCSPASLTLANNREVLQKIDNIRRGLLDRQDAELLDRFSTLIADAVGYQFYEAAEATKVQLSRTDRVEFRFPYPGIEISRVTTRTEFESAIAGTLERICSSLDETLESAGITRDRVEIACLTGGTSLVPVVERALRERLKSAKVVRMRSHHSVVQGLARCARALEEGIAAAGIVERRTTTSSTSNPHARSRYHGLI
jgi:hypothetical chaperone protein